MISKHLNALLMLGALIPTSVFAGECPLTVSDGWVRAAPPNARVMAGYVTFSNTTTEEITLTALQSPQFKSVEIHEIQDENGVVRMIQIPHLHLAPGQTSTLQPGGMHLMLIGPTSPQLPGNHVTLKIDIDHQNCLEVALPIKK